MIFYSHIFATRICKQDYELSKASIGCCWKSWVKSFYMTHPEEAYCNPVLEGGRDALSKAGKNKEESAQDSVQSSAAKKGLHQSVKAAINDFNEEEDDTPMRISSSSSSNRAGGLLSPLPLSSAIRLPRSTPAAPPSSSALSTNFDPSGRGLFPGQYQAWQDKKTPETTAAAPTSSSLQNPPINLAEFRVYYQRELLSKSGIK
jgi:hypothetical protein